MLFGLPVDSVQESEPSKPAGPVRPLVDQAEPVEQADLPDQVIAAAEPGELSQVLWLFEPVS